MAAGSGAEHAVPRGDTFCVFLAEADGDAAAPPLMPDLAGAK